MSSKKEQIFNLIKEHMAAECNRPFVPGETKIRVGYPCYGPEEIISAVDSLLNLQLSQGKKVAFFERDFAGYMGTRHGIAVNSGSSANLLAVDAMIQAGRIAKGSEAIVPATTFATVVSPLLQLGLVPVIVDVDPSTYNIDPHAIEGAITRRTGLLLPVHSLGCPADMPSIMALAREHGLPVLEDCCEAHGATLGGKKAGAFGTIATSSFFVAHNLTTGEGGMVVTDDDELDSLVRSLREFGRKKDHPVGSPRFSYTDSWMCEYDERYVFEILGYNLRMTDITAALGIEQLKRLPMLNARRISNAQYYDGRLSVHGAHLKLPSVPAGYSHTFYGYPILVKRPLRRTELVRFLESKGIETRAFMGGNLAIQPAFRDAGIRVPADLPIADMIFNDVFFIGCHPNIDEAARAYVCDKFDAFFEGRSA